MTADSFIWKGPPRGAVSIQVFGSIPTDSRSKRRIGTEGPVSLEEKRVNEDQSKNHFGGILWR